MNRGSVVLAAVVLSLSLAACGSDGGGRATNPSAGPASMSPLSPSPSTPEPEPSPTPSATSEGTGPEGYALIALCSVQTDLEGGDIERAEATFEDEVHETLHELADALQEVDREAAADLLVAKSEVEARFARPAVRGAAQARAVGRLIDAMRGAMTVLELDQPACAA